MAQHLYAIHDFDPAWTALVRSAGKTAWCVSTHELGDDPNDPSGHDFSGRAAYNISSLARLNYSHHGQGTIPLPNRYNEFAARCANFVANSAGCNLWIIGNEPNLGGERPNGVAITPEQYARCFALCRAAIKRVSFQHQVIVAAIAPYNIDSGPWITYWRYVLDAIKPTGADGLAIHCYGRGANPASIGSSEKMADARVSDYYNGFRAYRDFLAAVPVSMRGLPVYITETDQNEPWVDANTGWVQAAYTEIDQHNSTPGVQLIKCLALYRWYKHDRWEFSSKRGVIEDFRMALTRGYKSPQINAQKQSNQNTQHLPSISTGPSPNKPAPSLPARQWDERLTQRGIELTEYQPQPGEVYMRLVKGEYWTEKEHVFVETLGKDGNRQPGHTVRFWWGNGNHDQEERKVTEPKPNDRWMVDFPMHRAGRSYGLEVLGYPSDRLFGMGLGSVEQPEWNIHVSYKFVFQLTVAPKRAATEPESMPQQPATVPALAHPVSNPRFRFLTQPFGARPDYYRQFSVDGVPLKGHNGIDFGTPMGTIIAAVDDGQVVEVADEGSSGYGRYIKIQHAWGQSLYAHLDEQHAVVGDEVSRGEFIGTSGNSGNVTGPHLHFAMRVAPFNRADGMGGFSDPAPYLINTPPAPTPPQPAPGNILALIKSAAAEAGIEWQLLASLAWGESSWRPQQEGGGLFQIGDATWSDWADDVGVTNRYDARDNAYVAAVYLRYLLRRYGGNERKALWAWNWGASRVDAGHTPPALTMEHANKVLHGRDLLRAVMG